jgi:hypothetical protein
MIIDLGHKVRTDGEFASKLVKLSKEFADLSVKAERHAMYAPQANEALLNVIRLCEYNFFFLVPYYFPKYFSNKPLSFDEFPHASTMFNFQIGGFTVYRGSRQIGKSIGLTARDIMLSNLLPGYKVLYIAPRPEQLRTYANNLRNTERAFRYYRGASNKELRSNLTFKEFGAGPVRSTIELIHCWESAGNARGKTAIALEIDEAQDLDPEFETEISQCNSATQMPITIYSGTSTTTDSFLESKFLISSQGYWSIKCDCGHVNVPLPECGVMEMIQPQGPTCAKVFSSGKRCGRLLNVMHGEFVHSDQSALAQGRVGFHVPQIVVPFVINNPARWHQIYQRKITGDKIKFQQELLGLPSEEGEREITRAQLEAICILEDSASLQRRAMNNGYLYMVSGADWGGSEFNQANKIKVSTTVHVMLGILPTGNLDVVHMKRYLGMGYEDIAEDIMRWHVKLKGSAIATDAGVGMAYNREIDRYTTQEKHLLFQYVGPRCPYLSAPEDAHGHNQWSLNKTESMTVLFQAIKSQRIRCYPKDAAMEYLSDFLNMYRVPSEMPGGATTFLYRASATKPNDTAQAMNYAFTLGKILLGEPVFSDSAVRAKVVAGLMATYPIQPGVRRIRTVSG